MGGGVISPFYLLIDHNELEFTFAEVHGREEGEARLDGKMSRDIFS